MTSTTKPQWQLQLERDGFVVIPGLVSAENCAEFRQNALDWLEKFPHGFKRDDRSTWTSEHLPYGVTGGLYNRYSVNHEGFVWKIRSNPNIVAAFAQLWRTTDLIASFDGMNLSLPINPSTGRTDLKPTPAWPHIDQNPRRCDRFELYQGIANLAPNGPLDGGLCVLRGSHTLHDEHFASIGGFRTEGDAGEKENGYTFTTDEFEWFKRKKGCEEVKVCAGEGDLIIWDSRLVHWNASPTGDQTRFATYVCYCPRELMSKEELVRKREVFEMRKGTTHWPMNRIPAEREGYHYAVPRRPDDSVDPANRSRPFVEPEETREVLRLVGVRT